MLLNWCILLVNNDLLYFYAVFCYFPFMLWVHVLCCAESFIFYSSRYCFSWFPISRVNKFPTRALMLHLVTLTSMKCLYLQSSEALEFLKRDLTEFSTVVQHDTTCSIVATANAVRSKLAVAYSYSFFLFFLMTTFWFRWPPWDGPLYMHVVWETDCLNFLFWTRPTAHLRPQKSWRRASLDS